MTELGPVMDAAARFLEARPRSVTETRRRLVDAGYPAPLVEDVVARLIELGYLDDEAFARAWVESRDRAHPRGEAALRRELRLKGIDTDVVAVVLEERRAPPEPGGGEPGGGEPRAGFQRSSPPLEPDLGAALRLLLHRGAPLQREPDPRKRRQKAYALLARQGFDPGTCRVALEAWWTAGAQASPADTPDGATESTADIEDV